MPLATDVASMREVAAVAAQAADSASRESAVAAIRNAFLDHTIVGEKGTVDGAKSVSFGNRPEPYRHQLGRGRMPDMMLLTVRQLLAT